MPRWSAAASHVPSCMIGVPSPLLRQSASLLAGAGAFFLLGFCVRPLALSSSRPAALRGDAAPPLKWSITSMIGMAGQTASDFFTDPNFDFGETGQMWSDTVSNTAPAGESTRAKIAKRQTYLEKPPPIARSFNTAFKGDDKSKMCSSPVAKAEVVFPAHIADRSVYAREAT